MKPSNNNIISRVVANTRSCVSRLEMLIRGLKILGIKVEVVLIRLGKGGGEWSEKITDG